MAELELMPTTELESMRRTELELMPRTELESVNSAELKSMPKVTLESMRITEMESKDSAELVSTPKVELQLTPIADRETALNTESETKPGFVGLPSEVILIVTGAVLLGWLLGSISSMFGAIKRARRRGARSSRIRALEAELRIALADAKKTGNTIETFEKELANTRAELRVALAAAEKTETAIEAFRKELADARADTGRRDGVIADQQNRIDKLRRELRYSVLKTRELRAELVDRATENLYSEVKLRELEAELEAAHASTKRITTSVLDHSLAADARDDRNPGGDLKEIRH